MFQRGATSNGGGDISSRTFDEIAAKGGGKILWEAEGGVTTNEGGVEFQDG